MPTVPSSRLVKKLETKLLKPAPMKITATAPCDRKKLSRTEGHATPIKVSGSPRLMNPR
jgi:hypothetical protein